MSLAQRAAACLSKQVTNEGLNAFITRVDKSIVLAGAEAADAREQRGQRLSAIDGQVIGVKDNICTRNGDTTCASNILRGYNSPFTATVLNKLEHGGAVVTGKTNLDEFGMGSHSIYSAFGATKNPISSPRGELSAGGSSGGSAVAVASGQCWAALGTDTGGSVRLPASYCGIAGFKPSYGRLSRHGVVAYANSLDTVGILATNTQAVRSVYEVIDGYDPRDPTSLSEQTRSRMLQTVKFRPKTSSLRIGVPRESNIEELDSGVRDTWRATLQSLAERGHSIVPVSLPWTKLALAAYYIIAPAEAASNLAKYDGVRYGRAAPTTEGQAPSNTVLFARTRGLGFGPEVRRRILLGSYSLSASAIDNYFLQAQRVRRLVCEDFDRVFALPNALKDDSNAAGAENEPHPALQPAAKVDALLCPTAPGLPPSLEAVSRQSPLESYRNDVLTVPASLAGLPALSVPAPARLQDWGEPSRVGLQIIGQFGDEEMVLRCGEEIESLEQD